MFHLSSLARARAPFLTCACLCIAIAVEAQDYVNFEGPQVRPVAITANGMRLFAVNTPDNRVAVFSLARPSTPVLLKEIRVGLEPISVAVRTDDEIWVVNHESDSISVVSVSKGIVTDTIYAKDEPGHVVFAGGKAFVSVATDRQVRVFDAVSHALLTTIDVFGDDPKALEVSADGKTVWVAVKRSGNKTTTLPIAIAPAPPAPTNASLPAPPKTGVIVKSDDPTWKTKLGINLPDYDVVEIDVATSKVRRNYSGVGTILYNLRQRPGTDELWVVNTEARNLVRFEPTIRGHVIDNRVSIVRTGSTSSVTPVDLNKGISYQTLPNPAAIAKALALPTDIVFDPTGKTAFVASFGTDRIGVLDATGKVVGRIEVGATPGTKTAPRTKRGPRGLAHHPGKPLLYVLNRLANSLSVVDTARGLATLEIRLPDPTPTKVKEGRGFLYDAKLSGAGTMACAACHVDGRVDNLAWDLGDRGGKMLTAIAKRVAFRVHPMKGPMTTQTLQGLKGSAPFHWRGDFATLKSFNPPFVDLLGKTKLATTDMDEFVVFMESIVFGSNPNRNLDDSLSDKPAGQSAKDGLKTFRTLFTLRRDFGSKRCIDCHALPRGSNGELNATSPSRQIMKNPQLRSVYKKTGRKPRPAGRTSGFGLIADGTRDDAFALLSDPGFGPISVALKNGLQRFVEAFPTETVPIVGHGRTITASNVKSAKVTADLALLVAQTVQNNADLVAHGLFDGRRSSFVYDRATNRFEPDRKVSKWLTLAEITAAIKNGRGTLTFLGVPPGSGRRIGVDRDGDGVKDGDEGLAPYGTATPPCAKVSLAGNSSPAVGNAGFALVIEGAKASASGLLLLGAKSAAIPVLGLTLLVDAQPVIILSLAADKNGTALLPIPVPNTPSTKGQSFFAQAAMQLGCGPAALEASAGLKVTVQ